ncbi:MAG: MBL fold metallo-hydrolase [Rivularia sp. (in: cyanobacteria)]|jgi:glyoxylase-like metal-dependent hydrolase (beta-lactamase superfamily II)
MHQNIKVINLLLPLNLGSVNCYLINTDIGYILIDTGSSKKRTEIEKALENAGCQKGNLKLIVLTHGDFDHTGNAAYLRKKFTTKIAMHHDDSGMLERGDMFFNRKKPNILIRMMLPIVSIIFGFNKSERCKPDLYLEEGYDLFKYGFDAKVVYIPGHSKGSIGILTAEGDLFCGDLLENIDEPAFSAIIDDLTAANTSIEKLKGLKINTVYPGHGEPFAMETFIANSKELRRKGKMI